MFPADLQDIIISFIANFIDLMSWRHTNRSTFHDYTASFYCTRMYPFIKTPYVNVTVDTNLSLLRRRYQYVTSLVITKGRITNEYLASLINLEYLELSNRDLCLTEFAFGGLLNLRSLHCNNCAFIDYSILKKLPNLTDLECSSCVRVTSLSLSQLTNLVKLTCVNILDLNTSFVGNLTKLEDLTIDASVYNHKIELSYLTNLKRLYTPYDKIHPDIVKILPKLESIECGDYEFTDEHITNLTNLKSLICGKNCFFTDLSLKKLTKLEIFNIGKSDVIISVSIFRSLVNLTEFHSGGAQFPDVAFINMTNMEVLYCDDNFALTDMCLSYMPNLTSIDCGRNTNFTDNGISQLTYLKKLDCGSNIILTDYTLYKLQFLTNLCCGFNRNFRGELRNITTRLTSLTRMCGTLGTEQGDFIRIFNMSIDEIHIYNKHR